MAQFRRILSGLTSVLLIGVFAVVFWQRQAVYDWWRLRDYTPPAAIVKLADSTTMNDLGRKLFYVHKPVLADSKTFNEHCNIDEQTIILGCYITHQSIYVFDVKDKRLSGIEEVTAAHEMLHAAYDRLSTKERLRIDSLTAAAFKDLTDARIKEVVASYKKRDESVVPNELHSILATEVRVLPAELESYYGRYFIDRKQIVALSEKYEKIFSDQQKHLAVLKAQIDNLEASLKARKTVIDEQEASLNAESERLAELRREDTEAYNEAVPAYNARVVSYQQLIGSYNADVARLNSLIKQYNATAVAQKALTDAIDSRKQL